MSTQYDARCEEHKARNGRHYLAFTVESPDGNPEEFSLHPSPREYERLADHSTAPEDSSLRIGWVPAVYDDGWTIDWDGLASYSR